MERSSTMLLRSTIGVIGLVVFGICVFGFPAAIMQELEGDFDYGWLIIGLYVTAVPFFYALYQALRLLSYIDEYQAFSTKSVRALEKIKYCGLLISGLFACGMPYIFYLADLDDAPGLAALGFVIIGASFVVAAAASLFQKLFQNAVDIKAENDLTV